MHLLLWTGILADLFTGSPLSPSSESISRASRLSCNERAEEGGKWEEREPQWDPMHKIYLQDYITSPESINYFLCGYVVIEKVLDNCGHNGLDSVTFNVRSWTSNSAISFYHHAPPSPELACPLWIGINMSTISISASPSGTWSWNKHHHLLMPKVTL